MLQGKLGFLSGEAVKKSLTILAIALVTGACSQQTIQGQAFINGTDGDTVKLADISVEAIESAAFFAAQADLRANIDKVVAEVTAREARQRKASQELQELRGIFKSLVEFEEWLKAENPNLLPNAKGKLADAQARLQRGEPALQAERDAITSGKHPRFYRVDLKSAGIKSVSTRTDSDGRFQLALPRANSMLVLASSGPRVWAVPLPADVETLNISASNELLPNCTDCIFSTEQGKQLVAAMAKLAGERTQSIEKQHAQSNSDSDSKTASLAAQADSLVKRSKNVAAEYSSTIVHQAYVEQLTGAARISAMTEVTKKFLGIKAEILRLTSEHKKVSEGLIDLLSVLSATD